MLSELNLADSRGLATSEALRLQTGAPEEGLSSRLRGVPIPLARALEIATAIAAELRNLHGEGRSHGAVELESLRFPLSGISLGEARGGGDRAAMDRDIAGYGGVLSALLTGSPEPPAPLAEPRHRQGAEALQEEALDHARRCISNPPGIQHVVVEVRLLGLLARQLAYSARANLRPRSAPDHESASMPAGDPSSPQLLLGGVQCPNCGSALADRSPFRAGLDSFFARFGRLTYRCPACRRRYAVDSGMAARPFAE